MSRSRSNRQMLLLGILLAASLGGPALGQPTPPNFVFILADDLGWRDLGCFGASFHETPALDSLAASGLKFTQAYAACPVCSPSRAAVLTGKHPARVGVTDYINPGGANQPERWDRNTRLLPAPYADRLALDESTLAEALHESGYATFFAGKWHLGSEGFYPEDQGFDVNRGGIEQGGPYGGDKYFSPYGNPRLADGPPGEHLPDRLARETVQFIRTHRDRPFFAHLSFYSVHTPLMARRDLEEKYSAKAALLRFFGPRFLPEGFRETRQVQDHVVYAGMVEALDAAVGRVLDALDSEGLAERTVVIFTSDNGGLATSEGSPSTNRPLRAGKGWLYEGGIREPTLIRAPGLTAAGATSDALIGGVDFFPTLLELAGLPARRGLDGASLVPLLRGAPKHRGPLFWHYPHYGNQGGAPGGAVREGPWKLIEWYEDGSVELYNLDRDPSESYDLSRLEPERARRMAELLKRHRAETGAQMPAANSRFDPMKSSGRLPPDQR